MEVCIVLRKIKSSEKLFHFCKNHCCEMKFPYGSTSNATYPLLHFKLISFALQNFYFIYSKVFYERYQDNIVQKLNYLVQVYKSL